MSHEIVKSNNNNNRESNLAVANNSEWSYNAPARSESPSVFDLRRILSRRWKSALAVATTIFAGTAIYTLLQTPKYESQILLKVNSEPASVSGTSGGDNKQAPNLQQAKEQNLTTEIQLLQSNPILSDVSKALKQQSINLSVGDLANNLAISQAGSGIFGQPANSDVLIVSYKDVNAERAKNVLDVIGTTYVQY
ncbi:MAG: Wzz/FepE/Etk N-terminal domain-containing protein, partial [Xenococcaceae cyanobacterium]